MIGFTTWISVSKSPATHRKYITYNDLVFQVSVRLLYVSVVSIIYSVTRLKFSNFGLSNSHFKLGMSLEVLQ